MPEEILNIEYHTKRLLLRALNTLPSKSKAYQALGITEKHLYNLIKQYGVKKQPDGKYIIEHEESVWVKASVKY